MTSRLFLTMPTGYNTDIFGDAYSDMTPEEIDLALKIYDAIISSLLPEWLSWCGDELYAAWNSDTGEWAEEVDEDFDINELLADACETLWSDDLDRIAAKYLTEDK